MKQSQDEGFVDISQFAQRVAKLENQHSEVYKENQQLTQLNVELAENKKALEDKINNWKAEKEAETEEKGEQFEEEEERDEEKEEKNSNRSSDDESGNGSLSEQLASIQRDSLQSIQAHKKREMSVADDDD